MQKVIIAKTYLKKVYTWLKNHWYVPVFFLAACGIWFFYRQKATAIFDSLLASRESHKKEVEELNRIQKEEISKRDAVVKKYRRTSDEVEKVHADEIMAAADRREQREKELMKKEIGDIAKALAEEHRR